MMVCRHRLSLFGHVARMPENVPAKAVLRVACNVCDGVPPSQIWCRPWGHPPTSWVHKICPNCGLKAGDALNCARIGPRGERMLRPPWPCVDDNDYA